MTIRSRLEMTECHQKSPAGSLRRGFLSRVANPTAPPPQLRVVSDAVMDQFRSETLRCASAKKPRWKLLQRGFFFPRRATGNRCGRRLTVRSRLPTPRPQSGLRGRLSSPIPISPGQDRGALTSPPALVPNDGNDPRPRPTSVSDRHLFGCRTRRTGHRSGRDDYLAVDLITRGSRGAALRASTSFPRPRGGVAPWA